MKKLRTFQLTGKTLCEQLAGRRMEISAVLQNMCYVTECHTGLLSVVVVNATFYFRLARFVAI